MSYEELEERIVASDAMGFQIGIHAIGTEANNWILNAYEKAQEVNGVRDSRHRSEHAQVLIDADIPRFAELGVIASMQPTHCITDKRFAEKRIGLERSKGAYAWRRLLDAGAKIAFGTDYSVEPLPPLEGIYAAVTRKDRLGEPGDGWFPDQKLTRRGGHRALHPGCRLCPVHGRPEGHDQGRLPGRHGHLRPGLHDPPGGGDHAGAGGLHHRGWEGGLPAVINTRSRTPPAWDRFPP